MPHAEAEVTIGRSPQDVFAFLADGANNPRWRQGVLDIEQVGGGDVGSGTVFRQGMRGPMGRRIPADYAITTYEPARTLGFQVVAGPARPDGRYDLEPAEGGTRLRFALDWQPPGLRKLLSPMVGRQMPHAVAALEQLKEVLEGGARA